MPKICLIRRSTLHPHVMDESSTVQGSQATPGVDLLVVLLVNWVWMTMQARKSTISSPCNYIQARLAAKTYFETGGTFEQHERDPSSKMGEGIFVVWFGPVFAERWLI